MTQPKLAVRRSGREYRWPADPPHELMVPSSTTIIGGGIPKEALKWWAAKSVAEFAYDEREGWVNLKRADAVDLMKRAPFRYTEQKADIGTAVHAAMEHHARHTAIPTTLSDVEAGYARGAVKFLEANEPDILFTEATVFSRKYGYAGTFDHIGTIHGETVLWDWKTGKAVYDDYAVQLASYVFADFIAGDDGKTELPIPPIEKAIVVRLTAGGEYEAVTFRMIPELLTLFRAAKKVHEREEIFRESRYA